MTADLAENGHPETSVATKTDLPAWPSSLPEEEEISELLDIVLCADDLVPDAGVWHSEICGFFQRGNSQEKKADALKLIYGELDKDYTIHDGNYQVHVLGQSEGLVFQADGGDYFYSYLELSKRIDALILGGIYPFSAEEEELDDFAIPDEKEELEESHRNRGTETSAEYVVEGEALSAGEEMERPEGLDNGQLSLFDMGMESGYDPAMATGNFFSVLPESMADSRLYGVEIEPLSGHIAKHLYPDADIQVTGFEHTSYPDQFFDVVIGNIPFNSIKVDDPRYNRYNFRIHDYFLAKSLDKTRPGGIVAVITSKYTMDKANSGSRRYLAQRAELMGAIRLPNTAFKQVAGTEATTDILFLKKREREIVPDGTNSPWLSVEQNADGIPMNTWFIDHPEMVLGKMVFDESMYGNEKSTACHPLPGDDLDERLERAVSYLEGTYEEPEQEGDVPQAEGAPEVKSIPADPAVRNFSYALADGKLYYREHSRMYGQDITGRKAERIKGLVEITQAVRRLINFQNQEQGNRPAGEYEAALQEHIGKLNRVYDRFVKEYGYINAYANVTAFSRDANAPLLRSIEREKKDETRENGQSAIPNGQKDVRYEKTAIFYKATIRPRTMPTVVESAEEALKVSLNVKGRLDLDYMARLYRKPDGGGATKDEIIEELGEQIYQDPVLYAGNPYAGWQTAGEYLSGYVKDKLAEAVIKAEEEPERFSRNVEALRTVQPAPLTPQEISFSLGTPWIPLETYQEFMYEVFKTQEGNKYGRMPRNWNFPDTAAFTSSPTKGTRAALSPPARSMARNG